MESCYLCQRKGVLTCSCFKKIICKFHLFTHLLSEAPHSINYINLNNLSKIYTQITEKIKGLSEEKQKIASKSNEMKALIDFYSSQALSSLDSLISELSELSTKFVFNENDLKRLNSIEVVSLRINDFNLDFIKGLYFNTKTAVKNKRKKFLKNFVGTFSKLILTHNEKYLVFSSFDRTVRIWNIKNQKQEQFIKFKVSASCLRISEDDKLVLVGKYNGKIRIWDWEKDKIIKKCKFHKSPIIALEYQEILGLGLSGEQAGKLYIWTINDLYTVHEVNVFGMMTFAGWICSFNRVFTISSNLIKFFSLEFDQTDSFKTEHSITSFCVFNKKESIFLGLDDGSIVIIDPDNGTQKNMLKAHKKEIVSIDKNIKETYFATSEGHDIILWCFENLSVLLRVSFSIHVSKIHLLDDLIHMYLFNNISLYHFNSQTLGLNEILKSSFFQKSALFSNNKEFVIFYGQNSKICIWNVITETVIFNIELPGKVASECLAVSPYDQFLLIGCRDNTLRYLDLKEKCFKNELKGHTSNVVDVEISRNSEIAVSSSLNEVNVWDINHRNILTTIPINIEGVNSISLSDCCRYFTISSISGSLLFDIQKLDHKKINRDFHMCAPLIKFSRDGCFLVYLSEFNVGMIYDIKNDIALADFKSKKKLKKYCENDKNIQGLFDNYFDL